MLNSKILRDFSYGVYVVGTVDGDRNVGCVANSVMQITSNKIAISIHHDNYTNGCIKASSKFSVSVLSEQVDPSIIGTFGYQSSKDCDKYSDVSYKLIEGMPVLDDSCGYLVCNVVDIMETETHTIFLGEIVACDRYEGKPMTYAYYHEVLKGKSPKNAPTYEADEEVVEKPKKNVFVCTVCGYKVEIDGDELPDDYRCPICGKGKEFFKKLES